MKPLFAAATFALLTPGPLPDFELPGAGESTPLGYSAEWADELDAVGQGDTQAVLDLGHYEMKRGNLGRALAWFEYGTQLGDAHAQDHVVWLHPFLDDRGVAESQAFGGEIVLHFWNTSDRGARFVPLT